MSGTETRRSLYDGEEEADAPWFLRPNEEDDEERGSTQAADLAEWAAAERDQLRTLADTARLLGRLEQALRNTVGPAGAASGSYEERGAASRLALAEASDLLWLEGVRVRSERLWMHQADHAAAPVAHRAEYALGLWIASRLTNAAQLADEEGLRRFLGRRHIDQTNEDLSSLTQAPTAEESAAVRADWLAAKTAAAALHPLTQAAFLADHWRRTGPGGRERDLEATVIAAKLAAEGDLPFVPLGLGAKRRIAGSGGGGGAAAILARLLEAAQGGAQRALLQLARRDEWRARAAATPLKKNPAALIPLLDKEFAITTAAAEAHLGSVRQTALTSLNILRDHGLAREITGGKSYFYWMADLTPGLVRPRR